MWFASRVTFVLVSYTASSINWYHYLSAKRPRRRIPDGSTLFQTDDLSWLWACPGKKIDTRLAMTFFLLSLTWAQKYDAAAFLTKPVDFGDYSRYENTPRETRALPRASVD